jgi:hypothetical protein
MPFMLTLCWLFIRLFVKVIHMYRFCFIQFDSPDTSPFGYFITSTLQSSSATANFSTNCCHGTIWPKEHNLASSFGDG